MGGGVLFLFFFTEKKLKKACEDWRGLRVRETTLRIFFLTASFSFCFKMIKRTNSNQTDGAGLPSLACAGGPAAPWVIREPAVLHIQPFAPPKEMSSRSPASSCSPPSSHSRLLMNLPNEQKAKFDLQVAAPALICYYA